MSFKLTPLRLRVILHKKGVINLPSLAGVWRDEFDLPYVDQFDLFVFVLEEGSSGGGDTEGFILDENGLAVEDGLSNPIES